MLDETPLERALKMSDGTRAIEYCDQCANWIVIDDTAYCRASGKFIHPLMFERGQGAGPARNCKDRKKEINHE